MSHGKSDFNFTELIIGSYGRYLKNTSLYTNWAVGEPKDLDIPIDCAVISSVFNPKQKLRECSCALQDRITICETDIGKNIYMV